MSKPPPFPVMPAAPLALLASSVAIGVANWRRLRRMENRLNRMDPRTMDR